MATENKIVPDQVREYMFSTLLITALCQSKWKPKMSLYTRVIFKKKIIYNRNDKTCFSILKGDLVEEIHQSVNDYVGQTIRLYKEVDYIEFDWVIGPIPIEWVISIQLVDEA